MNRIPTSAETLQDCRDETANGMLEPFQKLSETEIQLILDGLSDLILSCSDKVKEVKAVKVGDLISLRIVAEPSLTRAEGYNLGIGLLARIKNRIDYPIVDNDIGVSVNCYVIEVLIERKRLLQKPKIETLLSGMKKPEGKRIIWE